MADYKTDGIRNVVLLGHGGAGKTTIAEAMLYASKTIERMGKTTDGNTVCDYDQDEIKKGFSLTLANAPVVWKDTKINVLDAPGFLDFKAEALQAVRAADSAIITVDARSGLEVGAELAWEMACDENIPKAFFINKCDDPEADFDRIFEELRAQFGNSLCPVFVPVKEDGQISMIDLIEMKTFKYDEKGVRVEIEMTESLQKIASQYRERLKEAIALTSEELLEKYLGGIHISRKEAAAALHSGIADGSIVPVYCGAAQKLWGIYALLDAFVESFPSHITKKTEKIIDGDGLREIPIDPNGKLSIFVFKTIADPFVGKMSLFKIMNGTLKRDSIVKNARTGKEEKLAHIMTLRGKKQTEVEVLYCGDIGVVTKLSGVATNDTLSDTGDIEYRKIEFPHPYMEKALRPAAKGDEDKISTGISRLLDEDPTLRYENNAETKQMTISGMGEMHLDVTVSRLKNRYGTSVILEEPRLAYRETIKGRSDVEGKHKKQSGGSGQYGHVKIRFSHGEDEGLTFTQSVVGGTVPKGYYPAVEKGLLEAMQKGVLAGYPVVNLAADLYDGSYHPVDSNEISFKLAAKLAYKEGLPKANPVILEPIGSLKVAIPDSLVGDVIGDLNKRRGRVLGMNPYEKLSGYTVIEADVPRAEMSDYTIALRAMSQGRGRFDFTVDRYEEAPSNVAQKIIAEAKKNEE